MKWRRLLWAGVVLGSLGPSGAHADLSLADWNNTGFDLSYGTWIPLNACLTLTPGYAEISGAATANGGAGFDVIQLDLSNYTDVVLDARLVPGNQATTFNIRFWDVDGTSAKYTFSTALLNTATFTSLQADFNSFTIDVAGSSPGLDTAHIEEWDVEGDQVGTEAFGIQFDQMTAVPEPASITLLGIGTGALAFGWRRRQFAR